MLYGYDSPSSSSSSDDDSFVMSEMDPSDLLSLAIKKRKALVNQKERNIRCEILQSSFISSLCKVVGDRRKNGGGKKRSRSNRSKVSSTFSDITPCEVKSNYNVEPLVQNEQQLNIVEPDVKRFKENDFIDPFGLEEFFKNMSSRSIKGSTQTTLSTDA